jgi:hypothetical protein
MGKRKCQNVICCGTWLNLKKKEKKKKEREVLEVKPTALSYHITVKILFFNG